MTWVSRDSQSEERKGAAEMQMLSFKEMRALYRLSGADKSVREAAERLTKIMRKCPDRTAQRMRFLGRLHGSWQKANLWRKIWR